MGAPAADRLAEVLGTFPPGTRATPLKGDASTRRFFRLHLPEGPSQILMLYPDSFIWEGSPLQGNHEHLARIGIPVPRLAGVMAGAGAVVLEDLGDTTLQIALLQDKTLDRWRLYREAIELIVLLQERGTRDLPPSAVARQSALDEERFLFELGHFEKHFLLGTCSARLSPGEASLLHAFFGWLAASLDRAERVLCHRDFQSRNLMLTPAGLRVIDYQDARMGPPSYDLASLLRDSSLDLEPEIQAQGIRYFLSRRADLGEEEFREEFARMALQRNIKDLGTFGYQSHHLGNSDYRQYIPRTVRMVKAAMTSDRRYHDLFPVFERHVFRQRFD